MAAVLGIADHTSWAEFVVMGTREGTPVLLARERVGLIGPRLPHSPYHHDSLKLPLAEAEVLVEQVTRSVAEHCRAALSDVQSRHSTEAVVMQESPFPRLPDSLAEVLSSWSLTCAADAMMYRESLADTAADLGMNVVRYPRKSDPIQQAADALGIPRASVASWVAELGRSVGPPWRKEHRIAAAAALWVLARDRAVRI